MSNEELEVAAGAVLKPQGGNYAVLPLFFSRNLHHFCRERA